MSLWVLVSLTIFSAMISVFALRQNNLTMVRLRENVNTADQQGGDVESALRELRAYVYTHMNTNLRAGSSSSEAPIQLTDTYNRIVEAEQARVATIGGNAQIYAAAQKKCEASTNLSEKVQCVQQYYIDNGGSKFQLNLPPKEFYTFDFVSPRWSPDLAGFALLVTIVSGLLLLLRLIAGRVLKRYLD